MGVHNKLMLARQKLQRSELHKSGKNKFAGYSYFELGDFLPTCMDIFGKLGLCDVICFSSDIATMQIIDTESGETITFTSPMAEASMKGCQPVQNLGATQTYLRRYLWVTAMAIVEHDQLDAITDNKRSKEDEMDFKKRAQDECATRNLKLINMIKEELAKNTQGSVNDARELFRSLDQDDQQALWAIPPTKGGVFTTEEKDALKLGKPTGGKK